MPLRGNLFSLQLIAIKIYSDSGEQDRVAAFFTRHFSAVANRPLNRRAVAQTPDFSGIFSHFGTSQRPNTNFVTNLFQRHQRALSMIIERRDWFQLLDNRFA